MAAVPVVGIGASAGGREAIERFLQALPERPGAAFVVLMHLDPEKDSALAELLGRHTAMPVKAVEPGEQVEANRVYLLPPDSVLELRGDRLMLLPRPADQRVPLAIDRFFHSLAEARGRRGYCVVLSGAGSDGTAGVQAVKGAGGTVLVQDRESARVGSMPGSAARSGAADFILPPEVLAQKLGGLLAGRPGVISPVPQLELDAEQFERLFARLHTVTGHDFSMYKPTTILRRLENRLAEHGLRDPGRYVDLVEEDAQETKALFRELLIGVTRFFRDPEAFAVLEESLERVIGGKEAGERVRVWVAGCASGEEAYSLAILLDEQIRALDKDIDFEIFASDIDEQALARARRAEYPQRLEEHLSAERLERCFEPSAGGYRVAERLRERVKFARQNLIKDAPFSRVDLISCRNLLIYFSAELQRRIVPLFHYALNDGGILFLGGSESVGRFSSLFLALDRSRRVYRKRPAEAVYWLSELQPQQDAATAKPEPETMNLAESHHVRSEQRARLQDLLLEEFAPPGAIVDRDFRVVHFCGDTSRYLRSPVEGANDLLSLARRGLSAVLRRAVRRAFDEGSEVVERALPVTENSRLITAQVHAKPLGLPYSGERLVLVTFQQPASAQAPEAEPARAQAREDLSRELRVAEESLHATIEELESSNEELRATNEEWQTANEELQSTNAELEASREELKSLNDELARVNIELEQKIEQVVRANSDIRQVLDGLQMPILFVGEDLRLRLYTPEARELLELGEDAAGLSLTELGARVAGVDLEREARGVLESRQATETSITVPSGGVYTLRLSPQCRDADGPCALVVTLVDSGSLA